MNKPGHFGGSSTKARAHVLTSLSSVRLGSGGGGKVARNETFPPNSGAVVDLYRRHSARIRSVPIRTLTKTEVGYDGSQTIRVFSLGRSSVGTEQDSVTEQSFAVSSIESDIIPTSFDILVCLLDGRQKIGKTPAVRSTPSTRTPCKFKMGAGTVASQTKESGLRHLQQGGRGQPNALFKSILISISFFGPACHLRENKNRP